MGSSRFRHVVLASLFAWGCGGMTGQNTGSGGTSGSGSGGMSGSGNGGSMNPNGGNSGGQGQGGSGTGNGGSGAGTGAGGTTGGAGGSGSGTGGSQGTGPVTVQLGQTEQKIEGFGINDNWATQFTPAIADSLFTTTSGIGLTILRTGVSDGGAFYNTGEKAGNMAAVQQRAGADAKIIGSVWSPPGSCKSGQTPLDPNAPVNNGGHVMPSCYATWSSTIASFAKMNGFYAMSIANEPDFASCGTKDPCNGNYPSTLFTATEMVAWVNVAGKALQNMGVKVIAPEASEWNHTWSNTSAGPDVGGKNSSDPLGCGFPAATTGTCTTGGGYDYGHYLFKDATAWGYIDILGVHEYDSQVAQLWPSDVNGGKPNKEIWQTEMSGVKWWAEQGPSCDINNGVAVAGWIHSALVDGQVSAWLWWWYQASSTDDNEGLILKTGSSATGCTGTDTKRHYTLGNYSKFIRPNYMRVDVTGAVPTGVLLSAYKGSDGTVVIVAINKTTSSVTVPISFAGGTAPASMVPNVTSATDNLAAKTAVTLSGGTLMATLAGTTVTSFVGK
jgi:glucuronoarabinoxylan endo-1,4-beta-xylanase